MREIVIEPVYGLTIAITVLWLGGLLTRKIAFLVAFAWLALSIVIHNRSRPSLGSIPAFSPLAPKAVVYGLTA